MNFTLMLRRSVDIDNTFFLLVLIYSIQKLQLNFRFGNGQLQGFLLPGDQINLNEIIMIFHRNYSFIINSFLRVGDFQISLNFFSYGFESLVYSANIQVLYTINRGN